MLCVGLLTQVMALFSPKEAAFLIYSIGYLNCYCPLRPEGYIELNISRREERVVSRELSVKIAIAC